MVGAEHTIGWCTDNEGDVEVDTICYEYKDANDDLTYDENGFVAKDMLQKFFKHEKVCRAFDGSGYCCAFVDSVPIWVRRVNKRKNKGYMIRESNRLFN